MSAEPVEPFPFESLTADEVTAPPPEPPNHRASRRPRFRREESEETPSRPRARAKAKRPVSRPKKGAFVEPLIQMYGMVGMAVMVRDQNCGTAILQTAPKCAEALDNLAYENEAVRRTLDALVKTNALGAVVVAHMPILMAVGTHHVPAFRNAVAVGFGAVVEEEMKGASPNADDPES